MPKPQFYRSTIVQSLPGMQMKMIRAEPTVPAPQGGAKTSTFIYPPAGKIAVIQIISVEWYGMNIGIQPAVAATTGDKEFKLSLTDPITGGSLSMLKCVGTFAAFLAYTRGMVQNATLAEPTDPTSQTLMTRGVSFDNNSPIECQWFNRTDKDQPVAAGMRTVTVWATLQEVS